MNDEAASEPKPRYPRRWARVYRLATISFVCTCALLTATRSARANVDAAGDAPPPSDAPPSANARPSTDAQRNALPSMVTDSGNEHEALPHPELELGARGSVLARSDGGSAIDYSPSFRWSVHGTLRLRSWLGVRLSGGMEYLSASVEPGSLGVEGNAADDPTLTGPHVVLELQPIWKLNQTFDLFALVGVGWQRFAAESFALEEPTPLLVNERAGVVVELPLSVGGRLALGRSGFGVSLVGTLAIPLVQTGALFDSNAGAAQSVRQDTGLLERVDAFQRFGLAYGGTLAFDLQL